tara:strand:- start:624 stop:1451 length:828 start_codon:yes stop_codon:yes gene_type:complete
MKDRFFYILITITQLCFLNAQETNNNIDVSDSFNEFFYEGRLIKQLSKNNITVTSSLRQVQRNDGKYFTFDISVSNNTNSDITLLTNRIKATIFSKNQRKSIEIPALTRKEYLKIKKRRQNMRTGLIAFAGGMSAASAGQKSSTTNTNSYATYSGTANTNASAYGNGGYAYGNATTNYSGNAYGSSTSTTNSYDGAAAYAASQNEAAKLNAFVAASEEAKKRWNDEYLKNHTLTPQETTSGLINIKYLKTNRIILDITINNYIFLFDWDPNDSEF